MHPGLLRMQTAIWRKIMAKNKLFGSFLSGQDVEVLAGATQRAEMDMRALARRREKGLRRNGPRWKRCRSHRRGGQGRK